jgi:hypothetical protein
MRTYTRTHAHIHTYTYAEFSDFFHVHTHTHTHTHVHTYTCGCGFGCILYVFILNTYIYIYIPHRPATRKSVRQQEQDKHADAHAKRKLSRDHVKENVSSQRLTLGETAGTIVAATSGSSRKLGRRGGWVELGGAEVGESRDMRGFKVRIFFSSLEDFLVWVFFSWVMLLFLFFLTQRLGVWVCLLLS